MTVTSIIIENVLKYSSPLADLFYRKKIHIIFNKWAYYENFSCSFFNFFTWKNIFFGGQQSRRSVCFFKQFSISCFEVNMYAKSVHIYFSILEKDQNLKFHWKLQKASEAETCRTHNSGTERKVAEICALRFFFLLHTQTWTKKISQIGDVAIHTLFENI